MVQGDGMSRFSSARGMDGDFFFAFLRPNLFVILARGEGTAGARPLGPRLTAPQ